MAARQRGDEGLLGIDRVLALVGSRTLKGEDEAGTSTPPSKAQTWARLYLLSVNAAPSRTQRTVALYSWLIVKPLS